MTKLAHLPTRSQRLSVYRRIRSQRRYLAGALALALPASAALAVGMAEDNAAPQAVVLGAGEAGVNHQPESPAALIETLEADDSDQTAASERTLSGGVASYYGRRFAGRRTASGEVFNPDELTAAHRTLPFGTRLRVTNQRNGKSVIVRVNDRGPFHSTRVIDLSEAAARQLGLVSSGKGMVQLALLTD